MQLHILADEADDDAFAAAVDAFEHLVPLLHVWLRRRQLQLPADDVREMMLFQHERRFIQLRDGQVLDDAVFLDIAEQRDLLEDRLLQRAVAAQNDDIGMDAHALQFLDRMLRRLGFVLKAAAEVRHQRHMDVKHIICILLKPDLTDRFQERLAFDIAGRAADLGDDHISAGLLADLIDEGLDLIGDVRDDLHRFTEEFSAALLIEDVPVYLAGRQVGKLVQVLIDESFIMTQVQVGLCPILGNEDLAVLEGTHRTGVDIDVGVELLRGDLQSPRLQQPAQRGGRDAFAQSGDDASAYEYIFCHNLPPFFSFCMI